MSRFGSNLALAAAATTLLLAVAGPAGAACTDPCGPTSLVTGNAVNLQGSTTLRPISDRLQTLYDVLEQDLDYTTRALGSTTGVRALIEGYCKDNGLPVAGCDLNMDGLLDDSTDIAQSSRPINASETATATANGLCVVEHVIALDGLAIIVHPSVNAAGLTLTQDDVQDIFFNGAVTDWSTYFGSGAAPGPIHPVSRTTEGGTYGSFIDLYICSGGSQPAACAGGVAQSEFNASTLFVGSNDEIVEYVKNTPGAVGYVGIAFLPSDGSVYNVPVAKTLADPPVAATFATVQGGTFAFRRNLHWYTNGVPAPGDTRASLIEFVFSRAGQTAVFESGYVPAVSIKPQASVSQLLLEPIEDKVTRQSEDRIEGRLAVIAEALDILDVLPGDANATTDLVESRASISEAVEQDKRVVANLRARVTACGPVGRAAVELSRSNSSWMAATAMFAMAKAELDAEDLAGAARDYRSGYRLLRDSLSHAEKAAQ